MADINSAYNIYNHQGNSDVFLPNTLPVQYVKGEKTVIENEPIVQSTQNTKKKRKPRPALNPVPRVYEPPRVCNPPLSISNPTEPKSDTARAINDFVNSFTGESFVSKTGTKIHVIVFAIILALAINLLVVSWLNDICEKKEINKTLLHLGYVIIVFFILWIIKSRNGSSIHI